MSPQRKIDQGLVTEEIDLRETQTKAVSLMPGGFLLASTLEELHLPIDMRGLLYGKSTYARVGLQIATDGHLVDPGYKGTLTLPLVNHGPFQIVLRLHALICQVEFALLDRDAETSYSAEYNHYYGTTGPQVARTIRKSSMIENGKHIPTSSG
jgi:dCTP deaminase